MERLDAKAIEQLIQKFETQGDVSVEEADKMFSFDEMFARAIWQQGTMAIADNKKMLEQKFPIPAIKDWHKAVAKKIEAGFSGNFIFSLPFAFGSPSFFFKCVSPALEALKNHGKFEDRITTIAANPKMLSLFPKYFLDTLGWLDDPDWKKRNGLYVLHSDRAGFYRYPRSHPENGKTFTVAQVFEKMLAPPMKMSQEETKFFSWTDKTPYVLQYLQQKIPYVEIRDKDQPSWEIAVFTNKENALVARIAMSISFEELVKNALHENIIDKNAAKKLLNNQDADHLLDAKFAEASMKYINNVIGEKLKWEATRKTVEDEDIWLDVIR